jgi:hypothetical protein
VCRWFNSGPGHHCSKEHQQTQAFPRGGTQTTFSWNGLNVSFSTARPSRIFVQCLAKRVYTYAVGTPSGAVDTATPEQLNKQFADRGYRMRALLKSGVMDKTFTMVTEQPVPDAKTASATAPLSPVGGHKQEAKPWVLLGVAY